MVRKKPFSLDAFFKAMTDKKGIAKGRAIQDWFGKKSDEATMELSDIMSEMQKKLKSPKGIFKGWQKTLIPILLAATGNPGAAAAAGAIMGGADLMKTDKEYSRRIKELEEMATTKGKYAGTFLENYIGQGLSGIKTDVLGGLTGGKKLGRWLGGAEILLSLLPGLGKVGKKAGEDVTKEVVTDVGEEITENVVKDKVENLVKDIAPWPGTTASLTPSDISVPPMSYLKDIAKIPNIGTRAVMPELPINTLLSGAKDLVKGVGGKYAKTANLLTKPLVPYSGKNFGRNLLSSLTTPSMYAPLLAELYKKQNIGQAEPRLQRAPNPYKRWN